MSTTNQQLQQMTSTNSVSSITANYPLPDTVVDYLIWYHLGRPDAEGRGLDAVSVASIYK